MKSTLPAGVYTIKKKDGTVLYRSSLTRKGKHISLGSFPSAECAHRAYCDGNLILGDPGITVDSCPQDMTLPFDKAVSLINLRDNGIYFAAPILLGKRDFLYYVARDEAYRFDIDDLFYYASHRIMRRGSRLFVADYGSQIGVMTRFGIRSFSVPGRDYRFINGDDHDLRYENIEIINRFRGVLRSEDRGITRYKTVIHVRSNYVVGIYETELEAAIAYNKAVDTLLRNGIKKKYELNYIDEVGPAGYAEIYQRAEISERITGLRPDS